ncbi:glycosyltransferase family 2 protein [Acidisphaera sp. L21]|uniref:glycosyltransferase family 2 protein n=1 Tax=Acidisphaera sp. L21 TaxID=1641851 RepID=UPI00131CBD3A|nr:glycosyltransferase family 2 protein [Acidisphaera sp. L21]
MGAPIVRLFITALGRLPDLPGLDTLVAARRAGTGLLGLAEAIVAQPEFLSRHGPDGPPDEDYLRALFWAVDGTDPDEADRALLAPPATRATILLAVSQSRRAQGGIALDEALFPDGLPPDDDVAYQMWLEMTALSASSQAKLGRHAASLSPIRLSAILVVPPVRPDLVVETIESLSAQLWPHWDCVLACPPGLPPHVLATLRTIVQRVPGVSLLDTAGPSTAAHANEVAANATGQMLCWLEAGDQLHPHAFYEAAILLADGAAPRLIYTDEDRIDGDAVRSTPWFKPDWSPDLALAGDTVGQLALFDRSAALADPFRAIDAPFERYGMALRLAHGAPIDAIRHIPTVLFHRSRQHGRPPRFPEARAVPSMPALEGVVRRHLADHQPALTLGVRLHGPAPWPALEASLQDPMPRVTAIIPLRNRADLLERCLEGLLHGTDYPDIEVVLLDNDSDDGETLQLLVRVQHDPRVRVLQAPGPFNWSALNNQGAAEATGDILLLLNNDIEVTEPGWLRALVGHVMRPEIGVVGARLLFPDGNLQHGGVLLGPKGKAVHALTWADGADPGYAGQVATQRDLSAVTGACLAIRRDVFGQVGGLQAKTLHVGWGDVDLCLRVREAGYRVLWVPAATLVHHEMATRGRDITPQQQARHETERAVLRRRWPGETDQDPFLNPNLDARERMVLACPPRRSPPWLAAQDQTDTAA